MAKKNKTERKQMFTRVICLTLAGLMVLSSLMAAIMSQIF